MRKEKEEHSPSPDYFFLPSEAHKRSSQPREVFGIISNSLRTKKEPSLHKHQSLSRQKVIT